MLIDDRSRVRGSVVVAGGLGMPSQQTTVLAPVGVDVFDTAVPSPRGAPV